MMASSRLHRVGVTKPPEKRRFAMSASHSDALVFFGATGDLAYKKIFPALQAMIKRTASRAGTR
jgi:hypothetical protein